MNTFPHKAAAQGLASRAFKLLVGLGLILIVIGLSALGSRANATPPAGTTIGNQASATYSDSALVTRAVTSNAVVTIVQQVASFTLTASGSKTVAIGGQVVYPHTLTNTGNGIDSFTLSVGQSGTTTLTSVAYYADANGDGIPDNTIAITSTGELFAGGVFHFVVAGNIPSSAVAGNTNTLTVTAASVFTPATTSSNTDTSTVSSQAVVHVSQALDVTSGASPNNGRTITLTYTNVGNTTATNLTLANILPSGMTYVAGSGRWSVTGSTMLTDANSADNQSGVIYDFGITASNRVTAVIASVAPGASGTLSFQININSGLPPGANPATAATATVAYNDGASAIGPINTNTVQYTVSQIADVAITNSTVASAPQGGTVTFTNTITNNGSGFDSFNISLGSGTFPAGTAFQYYQPDGVTPLLDSNGDGLPDTGPITAAGSFNLVVKAILPSSASGGGAYTQQVIATSKVDATKTAIGIETLTTIAASTIDLTNNTAGVGALGFGAGPEGSAVVTNAANPGATSRFTLVIANNSSVADSFDLAVSTDSTFAALSIPTGWTVVFKDAGGALVTNTGVISGNSNKTLYADVTPPVSAIAGTVDIYFRARSPNTGATDRLHDATSVNTIRNLSVTPNQTGQMPPGGVAVYSHTATNNGNVLEGDGVASAIALTTTDSTTGFTSVIYWDRNNDGMLDVNDPSITSLNALTGGTGGASAAAGLSVGESVRLFVKVTAPASAASGAANTTTLTATTSGAINGVAAPSAVSVTDNSSVIASQVTLSKTQAPDANCDGTADSAFIATAITTGAEPGTCVRYRIIATNAGASSITNLVVSDATPSNTTYHSTVGAVTTIGTISVPSGGALGTVQSTVGTLTSGQTATITFGVRIDP